MSGERGRVLSRVLLGGDLLLLLAVFLAAYWIRFPQGNLLTGDWMHRSAHLLVLLASLLAWPVVLHILGQYHERGLRSGARILWRLLQGSILVGLVIAAALFLVQAKLASRMVLILDLGFSILALWGWRLGVVAAQDWLGKRTPRRVLIVGVGPQARRMSELLATRRDLGLEVIGFIAPEHTDTPAVSVDRILGGIHDVPRILDDEVVDQLAIAVSGQELHLMEAVVLSSEEVGVDVVIVADFFDRLLAHSSVELLDSLPLLRLHASPQFRATMVGKRIFDLVAASVLVVLTLPVMIVAGLAIKLTSVGPLLFVQERLGLNGRRFRLYKFRSMVQGAEQKLKELKAHNEMNGPAFKMRSDPRVTAVGRIIRKLSIDELPQFFNVLKGEMSLVGPRPPVPEEVASYDRWQRRRLSVKPGLTCTWQVSGRNQIDFDEWMRLDLDYIDNWSPWLDLKIIVRTIPAVLLGRGAS